MTREVLVGTQWGNYLIGVEGGRVVSVRGATEDLNPSPIGQSLFEVHDPNVRIGQPMVRSGYLKHGRKSDGRGRGTEPFVAVSWDTALDLAAQALRETKAEHGNEAIYGGSYGWSSAGRFHHAQSQIHRFLNAFGGFVYSVNTYSAAAADVILGRTMGIDYLNMGSEPCYETIIQHSELIVAFGGVCLRNNQVVPAGIANHADRRQLEQLAAAGVEIVNISPWRDDIPDFMRAEWIHPRPATDVAIMLGLAHTLVTENLHDQAFLAKYCVGFERFLPYLMGESDGVPKTPEWAEHISEMPAAAIRDLARRMAKKRTLIALSLSMQRAEHGEQPYWMGGVLAAMLGQIGLPGGGIGFAWGNNGRGFLGLRRPNFRWGRLEQGSNPVRAYIPVARIADMLLHPGESYDYNGSRLQYPDIKIVYWAGGNPFHHHQDLNRLREAWSRPETIIVNESVWTATARHSDIVFPATTFMERNDIVCGLQSYVTPSQQALKSFGSARNDFDIFRGLADRLGVGESFSQGLDEMGWLRRIYAETRQNAARAGVTSLPDFDSFWNGGVLSLIEDVPPMRSIYDDFRNDPEAHRLASPSGKIEIYSETIARFGYEDCPGHPVWLEKVERLGSPLARQFPLYMMSTQPANRLHSQFDFGRISMADKNKGREPIRINDEDAADRGIAQGDIVRVYNDRGAFLASAIVTDALRRGVTQIATGAWYDPDPTVGGKGLERHGNPNVVTRDVGTSKLAQGPSAQSCLVQIERFTGPLPAVEAFKAPEILNL